MGTILKHIIFVNHIFGNPRNAHIGKDGHRTNPTIRLKSSLKSWIWDQYLPGHMKWKFGNL